MMNFALGCISLIICGGGTSEGRSDPSGCCVGHLVIQAQKAKNILIIWERKEERGENIYHRV
jgi:hypothetical protein